MKLLQVVTLQGSRTIMRQCLHVVALSVVHLDAEIPKSQSQRFQIPVRFSRRRNGNIVVGREFVNTAVFRIQVIFPRKVAKFSLNFWPMRVH